MFTNAALLLMLTMPYVEKAEFFTHHRPICVPKSDNVRILNSTDLNDVQMNWKSDHIGVKWAFVAYYTKEKESILFLMGDLLTPKGYASNRDVVIIASEWVCRR